MAVPLIPKDTVGEFENWFENSVAAILSVATWTLFQCEGRIS
jgi:hypothetical protein